jgi:hypothetical protein
MLLSVVVSGCRSEQPKDDVEWTCGGVVKAMTLYDVEGTAYLNPSIDIPSDATAFRVDMDQAQIILSDIVLRRSRRPIWKGGALLVIVREDGQTIRLAVSYYGAFFLLQGERGYLEAINESKGAVEDLVDRALREKFIPARKGKQADSHPKRNRDGKR